MVVAGVMSGTSADGIDVAFVHLQGKGRRVRLGLLAHRHYGFSQSVRRKILSVMNASSVKVADLARLNFFLGELYADAILKGQRIEKIRRLDLIGCHGQTIYHQGEPALYLGKKISATWQTGEGAVVAARTGVPVVSDFRPADLAVGGKGAPLVPYLDFLLFRHRHHGVILQNLGGIGNLTAIPAAATADDVIAFDTGPGNMVIDGVAELLSSLPLDRGGKMASRGCVLEQVIERALTEPFFKQRPPRTAGREQFGREFVKRFIELCRSSSHAPLTREDIIATATALTAASIGHSLRNFVIPRRSSKRESGEYKDFILSGGGVKNTTLMRMIAQQVLPLGLHMRRSDDFGLPDEAKEAVAFALLAYQTCNRQPGNVPSATGADRAAILGKISFP